VISFPDSDSLKFCIASRKSVDKWLMAPEKWLQPLLDTYEYDWVSVSNRGPECGGVINCRIDSFDQPVKKGLVQFPLLCLDTRITL
jgi:hypothetical protein